MERAVSNERLPNVEGWTRVEATPNPRDQQSGNEQTRATGTEVTSEAGMVNGTAVTDARSLSDLPEQAHALSSLLARQVSDNPVSMEKGFVYVLKKVPDYRLESVSQAPGQNRGVVINDPKASQVTANDRVDEWVRLSDPGSQTSVPGTLDQRKPKLRTGARVMIRPEPMPGTGLGGRQSRFPSHGGTARPPTRVPAREYTVSKTLTQGERLPSRQMPPLRDDVSEADTRVSTSESVIMAIVQRAWTLAY